MSATVFTAAVLAACVPSNYYADLDDDRRVICKKVAPLGSNIRRKTCRLTGELTFEERRQLLEQGYWEPRSTLGTPTTPRPAASGPDC